MSHRFTSLLAHLIFSTKNRLPLLTHEVATECHAYLGGIIRNVGGRSIEVGGSADHVHLCCELPATLCVADAIRLLKANSSKWIHGKWRSLPQFAWQQGYSGFSVSPRSIDRVIRYIQEQEEHHRRVSFQDEVRRFLREYGLEADEEHMWE